MQGINTKLESDKSYVNSVNTLAKSVIYRNNNFEKSTLLILDNDKQV
jgi:hypothetical protein